MSDPATADTPVLDAAVDREVPLANAEEVPMDVTDDAAPATAPAAEGHDAPTVMRMGSRTDDAISVDDLYRLVLNSFLNILIVDVQERLAGPVLVGALRRRFLRSFVPYRTSLSVNPDPAYDENVGTDENPLDDAVHFTSAHRTDLCLRLQADERVLNADLIIFYDDDGRSRGPASQLAHLMGCDHVFAARYLHAPPRATGEPAGIAAFAAKYPGLVEVPGALLPPRISDLRERQAALIQAVWYPHRSPHLSDTPHLIVPEFLYLGGWDAAQPRHLKAFGITHVVRIGFFDPNPIHIAPDVQYHTYVMEDAEEEPIDSLFEAACSVIDEARNMRVPVPGATDGATRSGRVLVHCHAGVSRSATIILAYMMRMGFKLAEAFDLAFRQRPIIRPNEGFGRKLQAYERKLFGLPQSTMPLCWMSFDYMYYREYLEFLIRIEEMGVLDGSTLPVAVPDGAGKPVLTLDTRSTQPHEEENVEIPTPLPGSLPPPLPDRPVVDKTRVAAILAALPDGVDQDLAPSPPESLAPAIQVEALAAAAIEMSERERELEYDEAVAAAVAAAEEMAVESPVQAS
ncbi:Serine/threonine/tyrosine-interacting-like protein 1 [Allomyces arbusculus]|nr:Serine/threonine/tyrosine-interacting-like protein 1 [Allomyces arbusculus]